MNYRIRMYAALIIALTLALFLNKELFFLNTPIIRKDPFVDLVQLPTTVAKYIPSRTGSSSEPTNTPSIRLTPRPTLGPYITPEKTDPHFPTSTQNPQVTVEPTIPVLSPTGSGWVSITPSPPPVSNTLAPTPISQSVSIIEFAQCLKNNGMVFYSNSTCPACQQQKALFGNEAFTKLNVVSCDTSSLECRNKGVGRGPAWITGTGKVYPGAMDLTSLHFASGCPPAIAGFNLNEIINQILSVF
jgi:hypothetical protein